MTLPLEKPPPGNPTPDETMDGVLGSLSPEERRQYDCDPWFRGFIDTCYDLERRGSFAQRSAAREMSAFVASRIGAVER